MSDSETPQAGSDDGSLLVKKSALYQHFLEEREEILRLKWLRSEERGQDIGFESALLEWMINHRSAWHTSRRSATQP